MIVYSHLSITFSRLICFDAFCKHSVSKKKMWRDQTGVRIHQILVKVWFTFHWYKQLVFFLVGLRITTAMGNEKK